jgi:hypothetical protein
MTMQQTMEGTPGPAVSVLDSADDIESELFGSSREMGVACFPMPDDDED